MKWVKKAIIVLLMPLAFLWEFIYKLRRYFYSIGLFEVEYFQVPILSVGNITFGGGGKTPFSIWLSRYLENKGKKVSVLMRGYKGLAEKSGGILRSSKKLGHNPEIFGDEALMIVRHLSKSSVLVGKKRKQILKRYFNVELPDVVILDDGHQHLRIGRNFNIVLFDGTLPMKSLKVAPLGYLREGLTALQDADYVLITRADLVPTPKIQEMINLIKKHTQGDVTIGLARYNPVGFFNSRYEFIHEVSWINGKKVMAIAGVASPYSFFKQLENLGAEVVSTRIYQDHQSYSEEDVENIVKALERLGIDFVITTEKDMVKIRRLIDSPKILFLQVELDIYSGQSELVKIIDKVAK